LAGLFSKLSIRWILPVAVVAPAFAVALVLTFLAYRTEQRSAGELVSQNIRQIHGAIEHHLDDLVNLLPAINQLDLSRVRDGKIRLDKPEGSRSALFETIKTFPAVTSIGLASAKGEMTWVIRYPGETAYEYGLKDSPDGLMDEYAMDDSGGIGDKPLRTSEFNPAQRPWYQAAVDARGPTWGNVYVWVRGGKGVTLGVPYVNPYYDDHGRLVGMVNSEITLSDISAYLSQLQIGKTGIAFIMERDGDLIADSIGTEPMNNGIDRLRADDSADPRIALAAGQIVRQFGSLDDIQSVRSGHANIAGEPMQMAVSSFKNRRNLDWIIVTLVPDADFLADVDRHRDRSLLISAAVMLLALGLGIVIAMWLFKPIVALAAHARTVGGGDLDARINRHDYGEIAQLSGALNEMADGLQDRMRLRHALSLAMEVQQSLLPRKTPMIKGLDIAARAKYCDETGGDYYDYLDIAGMGPDLLMVAIGDVMGHGIAAAMLMSSARGVLRSQGRAEGSLGRLLTRVNEHLIVDTRGDRFMTMFLALIDVTKMSMKWASAGHDQPLIFDPQEGLIQEIDVKQNGLPLGISDAEAYEEQTFANLRVGQVMLIGTDGLWEAKNDAGEEFGKERVGQVIADVHHLSAAEIEAAIYLKLREFCNQRANEDDVTYVVIKFNGAP
jgi:sigma-B regulation protein RsbU (phosphoserine phosphatase)